MPPDPNLIHTSSEEGRKALKALGYKELKPIEDPGDPKGKMFVFDRSERSRLTRSEPRPEARP